MFRAIGFLDLLLIGLLVLSGCSGTAAKVSNDVAAAEVALTAAQNLALLYLKLPRCGGTAKICSDPATVAKIQKLDREAYTAVHAAMDNKGTLSAATAAIAAFSIAIPKS